MCTFVDTNNKKSREYLTSNFRFFQYNEGRDKPPADVNSETLSSEQMKERAKKDGLVEVPVKAMVGHPPKLTGDWPYASDISLKVLELASSPQNGDVEQTATALVKIGGKVAGEKNAVFPIVSPLPWKRSEQIGANGATLNDVALAPDGQSIGMLFYFNLASHGSAFSTVRTTTHSLAAAIYNDSGMDHHKRKSYAKAAELFAKATYAEPGRSLFAYNLACALGRQNDARAEAALAHAISIDGDKIRERAQKDADFSAVNGAAWFRELMKAP
jgi:hypothetical protein